MFQSTRPRGARRNDRHVCVTCRGCFNPRARVGRDQRRGGRAQGQSSFNPRARVGRDRTILGQDTVRHSFNPRARVGRDPCG